MSFPTPPLRFVFLRPRTSENLGAVARAMKNFGLSDWVLVNPEVTDYEPARRVAVHAGDVLERRREVGSMSEAVADCVWVVGTTSRRLPGVQRLRPRDLAREAVGRGGRVALVFGDERIGLTNDELLRCHDLSYVPASGEQPSLNLAQAALLYAWELRMAADERSGGGLPPQPLAATDAELERLEEALREALTRGGFLAGDGRHAVRDLLASIRRGRPTRREVRLWLAALKTVAKAP